MQNKLECVSTLILCVCLCEMCMTVYQFSKCWDLCAHLSKTFKISHSLQMNSTICLPCSPFLPSPSHIQSFSLGAHAGPPLSNAVTHDSSFITVSLRLPSYDTYPASPYSLTSSSPSLNLLVPTSCSLTMHLSSISPSLILFSSAPISIPIITVPLCTRHVICTSRPMNVTYTLPFSVLSTTPPKEVPSSSMTICILKTTRLSSASRYLWERRIVENNEVDGRKEFGWK